MYVLSLCRGHHDVSLGQSEVPLHHCALIRLTSGFQISWRWQGRPPDMEEGIRGRRKQGAGTGTAGSGYPHSMES